MNLFQNINSRAHALFSRWQKDFVKQVEKNEPPEWMLRRIHCDLQPFPKVSEQMLDETMHSINSKTRALCVRFAIKNNQLVILQKPKIASRRLRWITAALSTICRFAPLPSIEFIICLEDSIDKVDFPGPVLAFAKHKTSQNVVLMPDMDALSLHTPKLLYDVKQGIKRYPWSEKKDIAFWRGATTGAVFNEETFLTLPRTRVVAASLNLPDLIDARFTALVQTEDVQSIQKRYASYFSSLSCIKNHLEYKYQLLIDGNTCAYSRAYWQLFSNCIILKQVSDNIQWFYDLLEPNKHFIPLATDLSDLEEKILWAKNHDTEIQTMVEHAQRVAHSCLKPSDVHYYLYLLLLSIPYQNSSPKGTPLSACGSVAPMSRD
jgi:hypothetical protein